MVKKTNSVILLGILLLFCGASIIPSITGYSSEFEESDYQLNEKESLIAQNNEQHNLGIQNIERDGILNDIWLEQAKLLASDGAFADYFAWSVSISGDYAIIGAVLDDDQGISSGSAYIFRRDDTTWIQEAKLNASDGIGGERFGYSVCIDGDYAVIGAVLDDDNGDDSGSAYIFSRDGAVWTEEAKLLASDGAAGDYFGFSVSINGNYAIIGTKYDDDNGADSGSAYIFSRDGAVWTEEAKLLPSDGAAGDYFGSSVSIDGECAIIGAVLDDDLGYNSGSAYIFSLSGAIWKEDAKLLASDGSSVDNFGYSVSISGDYVIVGAPLYDEIGYDSGSAYIFRCDDSVWTEEAKLLPSDGAADDNFGYCVSSSGDYVIVGIPFDDDLGIDSGSAYIFRCDDSVWTETTKLLASDGTDDDNFGNGVSINGDSVIVGVPLDDDSGGSSGSAFVFNKIELESDLDCDGSLSWSDVTPGETVTGSFDVSNVGDSNSELSWEISDCPKWGTWMFTPNNGTDLTPEEGAITVSVEVVSPNEEDTEFDGEVKIVNSENSSDFCIIDVQLKTPVSTQTESKLLLFYTFLRDKWFSFLSRFIEFLV